MTLYQSWIAAKGKVDVDTESEEPEKTRRTGVSIDLLTQHRTSVSLNPLDIED